MTVICIVTEEENYGLKNWLEPSCLFYGLKLKIIKCEKKYLSHRTKDLLLLEYLKEVGDNEIIFFTDAFDAFLLSDEFEILRKFNDFNSPLVFSAEINCWPDTKLEDKYPLSTKDLYFKYLNSGGFIGESGYIRHLIENYFWGDKIDNVNFPWSNQYTWNQIYLKELPRIKLDSTCEIFYTLSSAIAISAEYTKTKEQSKKDNLLVIEKERLLNEMEFNHCRFKNSVTNSYPCHLHFTSPTTKTLMGTVFFDKLRAWEM